VEEVNRLPDIAKHDVKPDACAKNDAGEEQSAVPVEDSRGME
jgi:hypothetical protein